MLECSEIEIDHRERFAAGHEGHFGAGLVAAITDNLQWGIGDAVGETDLVDLALAPDNQLQPDRQRVDHRNANPVQAP